MMDGKGFFRFFWFSAISGASYSYIHLHPLEISGENSDWKLFVEYVKKNISYRYVSGQGEIHSSSQRLV